MADEAPGCSAIEEAAFYSTLPSAAQLVDALAQQAGVPTQAMIELADRCNEACVHCYQVHGRGREMDTEEVFRLLDELAEMGVLFVTFSGGEPTLRDDFLELVAYARDKRFVVKVYSNGLRIDEAMAAQLGRLAVQEVQLSLYSHRPERHDTVTRVPGSWQKTVAAARALLRHGVAVVLKTPLMRGVNDEDLEDYVRFARSLGAHFAIDPEVHAREDGQRTPQVLAASQENLRRLRERLRGGGQPLVPLRADRRPEDVLDASPCGAAGATVHVEPSGSVQPCTLLGDHLGDARVEGVQAAWRSERAELLRSLTRRDLHGCRDCDLLPWCQHCYANAMHEAGDPLGPYPSACGAARGRWAAATGREVVLLPAEDGRDGLVGPYRVEPEGLRPVEDRRTVRDEALLRRLGWRRTTPQPRPGLLPTDLLTRRARRKRGGAPVSERSTDAGSDPVAPVAGGEGR